MWLREETWQRLIDAAAPYVAVADEVTPLHVADEGAELAADAPRRVLLGRHPPPPPKAFELVSEDAAAELVRAAAQRLGRPARTETRRGRLEREVLAAAGGADLLACARDAERPGPHSLAPPTRFVVDHAPCAVLLV